MVCKAEELLESIRAKEKTARTNKPIYTAAANELVTMIRERKAKLVATAENDNSSVTKGSIQFSVDKSAPDRLGGRFALLMEEDVKAISKEVASLVESGKIKLMESVDIKELLRTNEGRYSYSIVGESSRLARKTGLATAQKMLSEGDMPDKIKEATGWFLDKDAKWKFALRTVPKPTPVLNKLREGRQYRLRDLVDYKELFNNYPGISNLNVTVVGAKDLNAAKGQYDPTTNTVTLALPASYLLDIATGKTPNLNSILNTLGHEVQHAIQEIENFAKGGDLNVVKNHPKYLYLEKIKDVYEEAIRDIRPEISELFEIAAKGEKEAKENATRKIRGIITDRVTAIMKAKFNYKDEQISKAVNYARKYQLHNATPKQIAFIVYNNLLGEVEARTAGAMWIGETYDSSQYENIVKRWGRNVSASVVQALYDKETKQVILNEDVLEADNVNGVVYHEVGVHMYADVIRSNEFLQDKAVKLLDKGLKSSNAKVREFFVGVSKRLEEAGEVNNKEEVLAYLVEEGFNSLENHQLFNPEDRLDQALSKMRKILPVVVVDLIIEVVKSFVSKMEKLTNGDVNKIKTLAGKGLTGLTYDLGLQAEYNQIINLVRKGTKEVADKYKVLSKKAESGTVRPSWATPELMAKLIGDNTVAAVYNNLTKNCN